MNQQYIVRTLHGKKHRCLAKIKWTEPDTREIWKIADDKKAQFTKWSSEHKGRVMSTVYTDGKKFDRDTLHHHHPNQDRARRGHCPAARGSPGWREVT